MNELLTTVRLLHVNYPVLLPIAEALTVIFALALVHRVMRGDPTYSDRDEEDMDA